MKLVDRLYVATPVFDDSNMLKKWLEYRHRLGGCDYYIPAIDIPNENKCEWVITMLDTDISDIQIAINIAARVNVGESKRGRRAEYPCCCYGKSSKYEWEEGSGDESEEGVEFMDNHAEYYDNTGRVICRVSNGLIDSVGHEAEHGEGICHDMEEERQFAEVLAKMNNPDMIADSFTAIHKWEWAYHLIDSPTMRQTRMWRFWHKL